MILDENDFSSRQVLQRPLNLFSLPFLISVFSAWRLRAQKSAHCNTQHGNTPLRAEWVVCLCHAQSARHEPARLIMPFLQANTCCKREIN